MGFEHQLDLALLLLHLRELALCLATRSCVLLSLCMHRVFNQSVDIQRYKKSARTFGNVAAERAG
jgi:hypothetical protein